MPNCPATWSSATLVGEVHLSGGTMTGQQFNAQVAGQRGKAQHKCLAHLIDWALKEDLRGVTVGIPRHYYFRKHPEVDSEALSIVEDVVGVLQSLGARIKDVVIPSLEYCRAAQLVILQTEAFAYHRDNLRARPHDFGERTRRRFYTGAVYTADDYVQAQRARSRVVREFSQAFQQVDILLTPTTAKPAGPLEGGGSLATVRGPKFEAAYNLAGIPAMSMLCGFTAAGLPVGLQISAAAFDEPSVLHVGYAYQQATRWFERRPPL